MTPEEAYEEALRRIREAEETGAVELDLSISELNRIPLELKRLISLQLLNFFYCFRLSESRLQLYKSSATCPRWPASPHSNRSTSPVASNSAT